MSSKKIGLTYEGSLGACMRFAGQVLSSPLLPSQLCTKDALAPIVVEAHRYGQQVGKSCGNPAAMDSAGAVDPRKLLKKLQNHESESERDRSGGTIASLAFEDLTWDSRGDVAQMLEMELFELERRAIEWNTSVCVLFALTAAATERANGIPETAILWLPLSNNLGSTSGKKQYLLYACPGRIKVVKSVLEVLKKMREEIKMMNGSDASYNIWTLSRRSKIADKKKPSSNQQKEENNSAVGCRDTRREQPPLLLGVEKEPSSEVSRHEQRTQSPSEIEPPRARRTVSIQPLRNEARAEQQSIFRFTHEHVAPSQSSQQASTPEVDPLLHEHEDQTHNDVLVLPTPEETHPQMSREDSEPVVAGRTAPPSRSIVSSSYSSARARPNRSGEESEEKALMWQSLDSGLKKPLALPDQKEQVSCHDETTVENRFKSAIAEEALRDNGCGNSAASIFTFLHSRAEFECSATSPPRSKHEDESKPPAFDENQDTTGTDVLDAVVGNSPEEPTTMEPTSKVAMVDQTVSASCPPARAAPKNYKSKLGNRVWWELQCAAQALQDQQSTDAMEPASRCPEPIAAIRKDASKMPATSNAHSAKSEGDTAIPEPPTAQEVGVLSHSAVEKPRVNASATDIALRPASPEPTKNTAGKSIPSSSSVCHSRTLTNGVSSQGSRDLAKSSSASDKAHPIENGQDAKPPAMREECSSSSKSKLTTEDARGLLANQRAPGIHSPDQSAVRNVAMHALESPSMKTRLSPDAETKTRKPMSRWYAEAEGESDDDDGDLVQNQWASTRTSYLVEREEKREGNSPYKPATPNLSDHEPKTPFNVHGRVPIRSQGNPSPKYREVNVDDDSTSEDEDKEERAIEPALTRRQSSRRENDGSDFQDVNDSHSVEMSKGSSRRHVPHAATFIPIVLDDSAAKRTAVQGRITTAAAAGQHQPTREEKLAELRQKKLQQLHKAREESLANLQQQQQRRKKQSLEKTKSALSAYPGIESDLASATTTSYLKAGKKPTNRKLIQNALEYTLLAGGSMEKDRTAALHAMAQSTCENFIVLLKSTKELKFRALYEHHTDRQEVVRLFAVTPNSPQVLACDVIGQFFKYNTGKKEFTAIESRSFTMKTDACALKDEIVFKKKANVARLL